MLKGQVGVVTAGTKGIGLSIVRRLLKEGAQVVFCSRKQENVAAALSLLSSEGLPSSPSHIVGIAANVNSEEDRVKLKQTALSHFGRVDSLVSNAASNPYYGPLLGIKINQWDKIMETNVRSALALCQEFVPLIENSQTQRGDASSSSVVFVTSIAAFRHIEGLGAYNVSKTALSGLSKNLAMELAGKNIRCNTVAPGIVQTDFSEILWKDEKAKQKTLREIPLRRLATPDEIAGTVSFLLSKDSSYITGETITVSGGMQGWR